MTSGATFDLDTHLMLLVQRDDSASFGILLQKHRNVVVQYLSRMVQNHAVAEELAQDVFVRVYRSRHAYEPSAKFTTWLFRITTNVALNHFRDERHDNQNVSLDAPTASGKRFEAPDGKRSVEQRLVNEATAREIRDAIASLPEKQRAAVLMHKYQDMDYNQIAGVLGMSRSAVKALMFRSYERLRTSLAHLDANCPRTETAHAA
ncbi:MAG TPA: RNA polymerase sigma factor [Bryobacteraceae bacterium]|jgi:RNA polymerase sigma-70 factor (ECF subfamily)